MAKLIKGNRGKERLIRAIR
ncbi:hypothetical protein CCACVL1_01559 [Corchorus capsularis]|uniref:Uncharacterized protein n=1 Tax=Corchorus capsularis TaxID=210143 RepID=A0A1R3KH93_COCAP|nr:hypothetical protein CCACVL1_01559 [Corchorus capsularis]